MNDNKTKTQPTQSTNGNGSSVSHFEKTSKLKLQEIKRQAKKYKRIGTDYYIYTDIPSAKGRKIKILKKWKKSFITEDHGPKIFDHIEKFIDFVNIPDNTEYYKRNVAGCFNLYEPIQHKPVKGDWKTIDLFLKHVFGQYHDVGLDYLQLLYLKPTQKLPILCLVSKEQKTGKTTFLKFLNTIFGNNSVILGNEDFTSNFNAHWINKLIVGVDESFIEKRILKEKIKRLATDDTALQENKGIDKVRRDFFGKIILLSNYEKNFIQMDDEDNRFFVLILSKIMNEDPDILEKLEKEIPSFLHHLLNRKLKHEKKSRLWFSPEIYITDTFRNVVKGTKTIIEKCLIDYLSDMANNIREIDDSNEVDSIDIDPSRIADAIQPSLKNINGLHIKIGDILKDDWGIYPSEKSERFRYPVFDESYPDPQTGEAERIIKFKSQTGRFYKIPFSIINKINAK